jgi:hypothetical protein
MKTKNFLLTGALLIVALFSVNGVMAEGPSNYANSGTTTVNINLSAIQAILVNDDQVNLNYTTLDDYNQGVEITKANHLTVYSVGGFVVRVSSEGKFKTTTGEEISAGTVTITAEKQEGSTDVLNPVEITTGSAITEQALITSGVGGFNKKYNVNYKHVFTDEANAFGNKVGTYSAIVTYDISVS